MTNLSQQAIRGNLSRPPSHPALQGIEEASGPSSYGLPAQVKPEPYDHAAAAGGRLQYPSVQPGPGQGYLNSGVGGAASSHLGSMPAGANGQFAHGQQCGGFTLTGSMPPQGLQTSGMYGGYGYDNQPAAYQQQYQQQHQQQHNQQQQQQQQMGAMRSTGNSLTSSPSAATCGEQNDEAINIASYLAPSPPPKGDVAMREASGGTGEASLPNRGFRKGRSPPYQLGSMSPGLSHIMEEGAAGGVGAAGMNLSSKDQLAGEDLDMAIAGFLDGDEMFSQVQDAEQLLRPLQLAGLGDAGANAPDLSPEACLR